MIVEIPKTQLFDLVARQLGSLFLFHSEERELLEQGIESALKRCEHCFSHESSRYYRRGGEVYFNPFQSSQYAIFLYYLSNSIFRLRESVCTLADRVYYLNKALNGFDLFYEVEMPDVFFLDHPVGSVIGRGRFGNFFRFSQNCTVGNNKGVYPVIGVNVTMMSGAKILGDCRIGDHVVLGANAYVKDAVIPDCSIVFGNSPNLTVKTREKSYFTADLPPQYR
jgi:serine O-acetyltransferase